MQGGQAVRVPQINQDKFTFLTNLRDGNCPAKLVIKGKGRANARNFPHTALEKFLIVELPDWLAGIAEYIVVGIG